MDVRLDGRKALITGASQGLGLAMARKFAESGVDVAMVARRTDVLEAAADEVREATGRTIWTQFCDVGSADEIAAMYQTMAADFGSIDILVNNAGSSVSGKFEDITDEMWQSDLDLKLFGAIRLARLALPGMKERGWGGSSTS